MREFMAPLRYVQGPGALGRLGELLSQTVHGPLHAAVVIDADVRRLLGERIERALRRAGGEARMVEAVGPVRWATIDALAETCRTARATVVAGVGGGRALDCAKGVALRLGLPFASVPTVASTDAPASSVIAVYGDDEQLAEVVPMRHGPDLVLVDSSVIAAAPRRFLRAGIGDALSKVFEAQACAAAGGRLIRGSTPTAVGLSMARACHDLLRQHAVAALQACAEGRVSDDVEALLEAVVLLSPMAFEHGGLSVAHAVARALASHPETRPALHGEHVAYGLWVQLLLERRPAAFLADMASFYRQIGLPMRLSDLTVVKTPALESLAESVRAAPNMRHFTRAVSSNELVGVLQRLERGELFPPELET